MNPLFLVLVPALLAGLVVGGAWRLWRRPETIPAGPWAEGLALGLGFLACQVGLLGRPAIPPVDASLEWFPLLALVGGALAALEGEGRAALLRWPARVLAPGLLLFLLVRPAISADATIGRGAAALWFLGLEAALVLFWSSLAGAARRIPGFTVPLLALLHGTACALALGLSGNATLGAFSGGVTSTLGAVLVAVLIGRARPTVAGMAPVLALLLPGFLLSGHFYGADPVLPVSAILLLLLAPSALWFGLLGPTTRLSPRLVFLGRAVLLLAPAVAAVAIAKLTSLPFAGE